MRVKINGKRLDDGQIAELLRLSGYESINRSLLAQGYDLRPLRAPRTFKGGMVTFRFCWVRSDISGKSRMTFRLEANLEAAPV